LPTTPIWIFVGVLTQSQWFRKTQKLRKEKPTSDSTSDLGSSNQPLPTQSQLFNQKRAFVFFMTREQHLVCFWLKLWPEFSRIPIVHFYRSDAVGKKHKKSSY